MWVLQPRPHGAGFSSVQGSYSEQVSPKSVALSCKTGTFVQVDHQILSYKEYWGAQEDAGHQPSLLHGWALQLCYGSRSQSGHSGRSRSGDLCPSAQREEQVARKQQHEKLAVYDPAE